ncbi:unnamed protein product [Brachionus calyciflorus]|uniref:Uncharacterized protein n=1 Tax=Brachionus calyciflorus TaxID=104777 RepID=A0A814JJK4_9BILA|nr:unnamed protein product [Brachionus calyciflorus]
MNYKKLITYLKEQSISFNITNSELREISKKEGLINYTMVYLTEEKIIKVNKNETFNSVNELVMLKKNLLDNESASIYSNRTLSSLTSSLLDDSNIKKYDKERIKNVTIKCWRLYVKATGIEVEKKNFLGYCEEKEIEVPIKAYDKTVFAFMIKKFDIKDNFFWIDRSNENLEKLRLMKNESKKKKEVIPSFVKTKDILWDIDGIIGYRKKGNKIEGLCAWSEVNGKKFEPTWELLKNITPGNEQSWKVSNSKQIPVHLEDMKSKSEVLKYFEK